MFRALVERAIGRSDDGGESPDEAGAADSGRADEPDVAIQNLDVVRIMGPRQTSISFLDPDHDPATEPGGRWVAAEIDDVEDLQEAR